MKDKSLKEIAKKVVDSNYFVLIAVWIIMCIVFTKLQSNFFSYRNMLNILTSGSLVGLLCIGEAYLIIAGMIELSAGAVAAFSGVLAAILARDGLPLGAILPITIAGGLLFGLLNGLLVTKIKLQPFITTLATMSIARGLAYIICQVKPVRIANESLNAVGSLQVLTVPLPVLILVVLIAVFGILLAKTEFGRAGRSDPCGAHEFRPTGRGGQCGHGRHYGSGAGRHRHDRRYRHHVRHLPGVAGAADAEQRPAGAGRDDLLAECGQGRGAGLCAGAGLLPDEAPQQSKGTTAQLKLRRVAEMLCPDFAAKPRPVSTQNLRANRACSMMRCCLKSV